MRVVSTIAFALGLLILPARAADLPDQNATYSAQRIMDTGGVQLVGQVNHDHGKERWESSQEGMAQVTIMRPDLAKLIMYMPHLNMAMELPLDSGPQFGLPTDPNGPQPEAVGQEDIAGEATTKYRVEVDDGTATPFIVFSWVTDDGIVMRTEGKGPDGEFVMYLTQLTRGPQDAALFEIPAGAQLMPINPALLEQLK